MSFYGATFMVLDTDVLTTKDEEEVARLGIWWIQTPCYR